MLDLEQLVTLEEAAERFGVTLGSLRRAATRGRISTRKVGRRGRGLLVTTIPDVGRYVAEVAAWNASGRVPRGGHHL